MEDKSPTDEGKAPESGDEIINNPSLPDEDQQDPSADDPQDTGSGESQDSVPTEDQPQPGSTGAEGGSDDDKGLAKFAKAQGIDDISSLTEREIRLLKVARDNQRSARESKQEDKDALRETVEEIYKPGEGPADEDEFERRNRIADERFALLEARQQLSDFWRNNEGDEGYEKEMKELLLDELKTRGPDAARFLSQDLNRLLVLAKARRGDNSAEAAREAGRREEREELRRKQEAGGEFSQASSSTSGKPKWTREDIDNMSVEEYEKNQAEIDELIASGKL